MVAKLRSPFPKVPHKQPLRKFSKAEYSNRLKRVKEKMKKEDLDVLLISGNSTFYGCGWANVRYLTNFTGTLDDVAYVIVPMAGDPALIVSEVHVVADRAYIISTLDDIRFSTPLAYVENIVEVLAENKCTSGKLGIVAPNEYTSIPYNHLNALMKELPKITVSDETELLLSIRRIKSEAEIQSIVGASKLCDIAAESLCNGIRAGMTESDLFAIVEETVVSNGGELPFFSIICSTPTLRPTVYFPHPQAYGRRLRSGDIVIAEIGPKYADGYGAQVSVTAALGKPPNEYYSIFETALESYENVTDNLRSGSSLEKLLLVGEAPMKRNRLIRVAPLFHGYGLSLEQPYVGLSKSWGQRVSKLESNMTGAVESHPVNRGRITVRVGSTYLVTSGSPKRLTKFEPQIFVS